MDKVLLFWKSHRLKAAIVVTILIWTTRMVTPIFNQSSYDFIEEFTSSILTLGLYLIGTPFFMLINYFYKIYQADKIKGVSIEVHEILNLDTYLNVFTVYSTLAFITTLILDELLPL